MRVQLVEGEYRVVLPPEAVATLNLTECSPVEIVPVAEQACADHRRMTVEEGLAAFRGTELDHRNTYRELAS